ncbi:MAG: chemotaxis protein CheA [Bacteriovoracaceae bacterium]|nr:chemotaxis protein CheA [Bacteriovoracaceae bacterium]
MSTDDEFLKEIQEDFISEAKDLVERTESCFLNFEKNPTDQNLMSEILRLFHNLKGSSKAVGFDHLANFSHQAEDFLVAVRDGGIESGSSVADILLKINDTLGSSVQMLEEGEDPSDIFVPVLADIAKVNSGEIEENETQKESTLVFHTPKSEDFDEEISWDEGASVSDEIPQVKEDTPSMSDDEALALLQEMQQESTETVESIGSINFESEDPKMDELPPAQASIANDIVREVKPVETEKKAAPKAAEPIKVGLDKIDKILNSFGEQVILQSKLAHLVKGVSDVIPSEILSVMSQLEKITSDLQATSMNLRMVCIKTVFNRMERVARETAKATGKKIVFTQVGADSELDKTIVDSLIDPLTHMVRNAIDHGIETSEERIKAGKNEEGEVILGARRQGGFFVIEVKDNGKGLSRELIAKKAIEKGLIASDEGMDDSEIYNLIFKNGFSTKDVATDVSGRGVGMDVVREMFKKLKGTCEIQSILGEGSVFTVKLPLSLALFQGTVIEINGEKYIIPNSDFKETGVVDSDGLEQTSSGDNVLKYKDRLMPAISLNSYFPIKGGEKKEGTSSMVAVVNVARKEYALIFDEILSQERVVLKKLDVDVEQVKGVSGGTILGDGKVALILELSEIVGQFYETG